MSSALYSTEILRLATSIPHLGALETPQGRAERRAPVCGSKISADVVLDEGGRVKAVGFSVSACALGQASTALLGQHVLGQSLASLEAARDSLAAFLAGEREEPGAWPGLHIFAQARSYPARHAAIRLPFEAIVDAVRNAG